MVKQVERPYSAHRWLSKATRKKDHTMRSRLWRSAAVALLAAYVVGGRGAQAIHAARPSTASIRFSALDGGATLLPNITITAMAFAPRGTIYATGLALVKNTSSSQPGAVPQVPTVSVWLVSHDHEAHWTERISTRDRALQHPGAVSTVAGWRDHTRLPIEFAAKNIVVDPRDPRVIYLIGCLTSALLRSQPGTDSPEVLDAAIGGSPAAPYLGRGITECITGARSQYILRSMDGGRTWTDALWLWTTASTAQRFHSGVTNKQVVTNIMRTHDLMARLNVVPWPAGIGYALAIDPYDDLRIYAVTDLGLLWSDNRGLTWHYAAQPIRFGPQPGVKQALSPAHLNDELIIDRAHPNAIYDLDHAGFDQAQYFYRSTDRGVSWQLVNPTWGDDTTVRSLVLNSGLLYAMFYPIMLPIFAGDVPGAVGPFADPHHYAYYGVQESKDGGLHWQQVTTAPIIGGQVEQTIRGAGGWVALAYGRSYNNTLAQSGLYIKPDGGGWSMVARRYNRLSYASDSMGAWAGPRVEPQIWEDHTARVVFLARPLGGLRRWQSGL